MIHTACESSTVRHKFDRIESSIDRRAGKEPTHSRLHLSLKRLCDLRLREHEMEPMRRTRISVARGEINTYRRPCAHSYSHVELGAYTCLLQLFRIEQPVVAQRVPAAHVHERRREAFEGGIQERRDLRVCRRAFQQVWRRRGRAVSVESSAWFGKTY